MHMRRGRGAGAVEGKSTADGRRTEEGGRTGPRASGHGTVEWSVVGLATGRRPFRPGSTRPCSRRSNGHAGYVDMSHARERGGHRGGRGACGPGRAAGTARDRRQVRRAPRPLFAPCPPVLVVLPYLPSIPLLPPCPRLPSCPRLSPFSARLLAAEPHRHARTCRWRRTPPCSPLPSSPRVGLCPVCSPLCVAVRAFQLPLCPSAFLLRQRSRGLGLGLLLTSPRRTDTRDARARLLCVLNSTVRR